jgi:hypothetical protein
VDTLIQQSFDAAIVTDGTCDQQVADGNYMTRAVINVAVATIRGKNGLPFEGGNMRGLIHPYVLSDVANDITNNGVLDVEKHTREGQEWIEAGLVRANKVIPVAGVDFVTTTNVPLLSNSPTTGKSSWCTYISAEDTIFSIGLGGFEDVPDQNNFHASIYQFEPSAFDPGGEIAGAVSYNFKFVATPRPGTTMPFRRIKSETAVA